MTKRKELTVKKTVVNVSKSFSFILNILKLKGINYVIDDDVIIRAQGVERTLSALRRIGLVTSTDGLDYYIGVRPPIYIAMDVDSGKFGDELSIFDYSGIVNEIKDILAARKIVFTEEYEDTKIVLRLAEPQTLKQLDAYIRSCEGITAIGKFSTRSTALSYNHSSCATLYVSPHSIIIN